MEFLWLLLVSEILLFVFAFYFNRQDIMAPSVIMCAVFIFSTVIAIFNGENWNIDYDFRSFVMLSTGILTFAVVDVIVSDECKAKREKKSGKSGDIISSDSTKLKVFDMKLWKILIVIIADIVILGLYYSEVVRIAGTVSEYSDYSTVYAYRLITSHGTNLTSEQYMNTIVTQLSKIVTISGFVSAYMFVNDVIVNRQRSKKNFLLLISPVCLCVMTLMSGVRTDILRLVCFVLVTSYILLQVKTGWTKKLSWQFIKVLAIAVVAVLILFGLSQSLLGRSGNTDVLTVISNYAGASIQHFNQYIQNPPAANEVWGQETFAGFWKSLYKLGLVDKSYSVHLEYRSLNANNMGNVYTFFRRFLQDFGTFGMYIATIIFAALISGIYNGLIKGHAMTYRWHLHVIEYGYLFYIVAMSSIQNLIQNYVNVGMIVLVILLYLYFYFAVKFDRNKMMTAVKKHFSKNATEAPEHNEEENK